MTATVIQGDARALPLADDSVDLICTSPPYYQLRSYRDGGEHYASQIGAEATPGEYIDALIDCTREWMRVLKPSGSIFVNLGDKYAGSDGTKGGTSRSTLVGSAANGRQRSMREGTFDGGGRRAPGRPKSLLFLPERYRIAATDRLGLTGRAVICWSKPNSLPESVTDRVRRSHEDWVHLTKEPRYFSAVDEIREPHVRPLTAEQLARNVSTPRSGATRSGRTGRPQDGGGVADHVGTGSNPLGKLPGSVWQIATQPLTVPAHLGVDHFASFPLEWPRRIIRGWSPSGICTACGEGRRPVSGRELTHDRGGRRDSVRDMGQPTSARRSSLGHERVVTVIGYACGCPDATAPTRPGVVVDPFGGTGTTALVADVLGRTGISIDASGDYCRIARWRTTDPGERARALGVPKPPKQVAGQVPLFDLGSTT